MHSIYALILFTSDCGRSRDEFVICLGAFGCHPHAMRRAFTFHMVATDQSGLSSITVMAENEQSVESKCSGQNKTVAVAEVFFFLLFHFITCDLLLLYHIYIDFNWMFAVAFFSCILFASVPFHLLGKARMQFAHGDRNSSKEMAVHGNARSIRNYRWLLMRGRKSNRAVNSVVNRCGNWTFMM